MQKLLLSVLLILSITRHSVNGWFNQYDQEFTFTCPANQFLSHIRSIHNNHYEDRVFEFACKNYPFGDHDNCYDSGYVNDYDQLEVFQCPHGGAIVGISSIHNNHNEDRRYKFRCCEGKGMCMVDCKYSGFVNHYDQELDYTVENNYVLRGITSTHDNHHEDRIFNFEVCKLQEC